MTYHEEQQLAAEKQRITAKLATLPSFLRGVQAGALMVGGFTTILGENSWSQELRYILGGLFLLLAVNCILAQRGWMYAKRISRA